MKDHLRYVFVFTLIVSFTDLNCQMLAKYKPHYIFGLNLSTMTIKNKDLSSFPETPVGIHFGAILEIPVTRKLAFRPGFLFTAKGTNYKIDSVAISLSPIYIEIPVMTVYTFGSDAIRISLFAGPYFDGNMGLQAGIWK